ncbi:orotate phosphoribosyltransferase [Rappaport israeli]|uniref:orotate phosphoribosyltransferase n=1 Tax=Rappaport israeli TaxID=1839807 RepID=UPI00093181D5|nr:orotate phosphoribosyltransferase [Rappaport israeli]
MLANFQQNFLQTAVAVEALKFGSFTLKSGRQSPYFFNAGAFNDGQALLVLATSYAEKIWQIRTQGNHIDVLFGPAYKGIPLVAAIATVLASQYNWSVKWAFNRKEEKQHGEGGQLVGADVDGQNVLVIDDVLTAGTAIRQSLALLRDFGAKPSAVLVALDRMERIEGQNSALTQLAKTEQIQTHAVVNFNDLLTYLKNNPNLSAYLEKMQSYRKIYGV